MFSRVPQPLAFAEALLAQFGALSRETDIAALLGGFARAVGELSGCELSQLYLLDQTHTALTLNAECRDGLLQALEPSSLPADYTGEQLLQFALCQNRVVSLVDLPSRLHETGFLPAGEQPWLSLLCVPLVSPEKRSRAWWSAPPGAHWTCRDSPIHWASWARSCWPSCICCNASRNPPASRRDRPARRWSAATG